MIKSPSGYPVQSPYVAIANRQAEIMMRIASRRLLLILTGYSIFDPLIAGGVAVWIIASTAREVVSSHDELIWPEKLVCCHTDYETTAVGAR
jgi:hypothetical protein